MNIRTDLALESVDMCRENLSGITKKELVVNDVKVTKIEVKTEEASKRIARPIGIYITIEAKSLTDTAYSESIHTVIRDELRKLLPENGIYYIIGVGNPSITPDALGPKTADKIIATRHISKELAERIGLKGLKSVSVLSPGVLGQTGMEVKEIAECTAKIINPSAVIIIDALAAREIDRLGKTVQISNTGISPGSGVGNDRQEISRNTIGIPCISIGIPTVVDASTLCYDLTGKKINKEKQMIVTLKEIDTLIDKSSDLLGHAINCAIQSDIDEELLMYCV